MNSIILLSLFYYFIEHTIFVKSCLTIFLSILSFIITYINKETFYLYGSAHPGYLTLPFNTFFRNYLLLDTVNHIHTSYKKNVNIRKDLLLHHFIILIPFTFRTDLIGLTFSIMGEMFYCWIYIG